MIRKKRLWNLIGAEIDWRIAESYPKMRAQSETAAPESQGAAVDNSVEV